MYHCVSVQNEVKRIVFTKPLYAVSYFACFLWFFFFLLYSSLWPAIFSSYCLFTSLLSRFCTQRDEFNASLVRCSQTKCQVSVSDGDFLPHRRPPRRTPRTPRSVTMTRRKTLRTEPTLVWRLKLSHKPEEREEASEEGDTVYQQPSELQFSGGEGLE